MAGKPSARAGAVRGSAHGKRVGPTVSMPRHRARIQTPAPTSLAPPDGEECSRGPPHGTYRRIYAGGRATEPSEVLQEMGGEKGAQCPGEATAPWVRPDEGVGEKARGAALKPRTETAPALSSRCYARPPEEAFAPEGHSRSARLHRLATVMSISADGTRDSV